MVADWRDFEIDRLGKRIDRIERERREEKDRVFRRTTRALFVILWLEVAAIWAMSIAQKAGAL